MPSDTAQLDDLYYGVPGALTPLVSSILPLTRFYNRPRPQYYQLLNIIDTTMEQTSALLTKLQGATTFTKFRDLPPEIRIKIWQFAMPEARTIVIKSPHTKPKDMPASLDGALPQMLDTEISWQSTTQIPALLHVNCEARYEALKHYSLSLCIGKAQPTVYIDFSRDTLFLGDAELKPECSSLWAKTKDLDKIQRLAVVPEGAFRALRFMKIEASSLQKLIFVSGSEKIKLGPLPQLVEDEQPPEAESTLELEQLCMLLETTTVKSLLELESSKKQRIEAARDEFNTLKEVLMTNWEKEPAVSTAVFRKSRGDRWAC
ncbi:hypothetical protein O1611_g10601 [Lasiodiplodia mahajangana]|uniref:Uncharacterized protein n=1 Tax=Lasiodiplodia mahajangana TaxID=1108764 RepID=A0ACC2IWN3_9PEZI|nr:hypothetical protein O1611_g10601 [Lasiodiplodia mahajangana]